MGTILPSFYIDDACKRLKRIANSLDRYIQGKATINLDLTMFNYNDVLNNIRLAFLELENCDKYIRSISYMPMYDNKAFYILMREYKILKEKPDTDLSEYVNFANKVCELFDDEHPVRSIYSIYDTYNCSATDFTRNYCSNMDLFGNILRGLIRRANRPVSILNMNVEDGVIESNIKQVEGDKVSFYGIKYDNSSCIYDRHAFNRIVKTTYDINNYRVSNNAFDITMLNCFYSVNADSSSISLLDKPEIKLIKRAISYTLPGGVIAIEIYKCRLYKDVVTTLVKNLDNIRVYDTNVFIKQHKYNMDISKVYADSLIIVGVKRNEPDKNPDVDVYNKIQSLAFTEDEAKYYPGDDFEFTDYSFPLAPPEISTFRGSIIDEDEILEAYKNTQSFKEFEKSQCTEKISDRAQKSLLPFSVGQLGIILTSGCLDGLVDEGNNCCHVVKGRIVKEKSTETFIDTATHMTEYHDTYNNRVEINAFLPNGEFKRLA